MKIRFIILSLLLPLPIFAQTDADILKIILQHYYKTEKIVHKGRTQFLFLYCEKPNNNEQLFETVDALKISPVAIAKIKKQVITDTNAETWTADLEKVYASDKTKLQNKINSCFSLEEYQIEYQKRNVNNQRMMIISKPILYDANHAIVKVVFYRTIEHNNGSVLHLEKIGSQWVIKEFLNPWST